MERLTFDGNFCDIAQCMEPVCPCPDTGCSQKQVWERLKEYEDTGLMPEAIKDVYARFINARRGAKEIIDAGYSPERIDELLQADEDGRIVVLPCKVGDTVYWVDPALDVVVNGTVTSISAELLDSIGKIVFLTREAAEAAMKERESNETD